MKLTKATSQAIKYACLHYHYSKSVPVNPLGYNVYNDKNEWCGVILYSLGANKSIGNQYDIPMGGVLELTRVALNGKQEHTSQAVAMSLKQLKKDVPQCRLVVSYADCDQEHLGTIYQATNWIYTGQENTNDISAFIINGKKTHKKTVYSHMVIINGKKQHCPQNLEMVRKFFDPNAEIFRTKGKRKYLMPLDKKMRNQIEPLRKPYPKTDEKWSKIDRNQFKIEYHQNAEKVPQN